MRLMAYFAGAGWHLLAPTWRAEQAWRRIFGHLRDVATLVAAVALWGLACWAATL